MSRWLALIPGLIVAQTQLSSCTTRSCTAKGCINGAQITLDSVSVDAVAGGRLRVCRNQICDTVEIAADGSRSYVEHSLGSEVLLHAQPGTEMFEIIVQDNLHTALVDGDVYTIEAWDANGTSLATLQWTATYSEDYPNGPDCDEVPCRTAYLDSTNQR